MCVKNIVTISVLTCESKSNRTCNNRVCYKVGASSVAAKSQPEDSTPLSKFNRKKHHNYVPRLGVAFFLHQIKSSKNKLIMCLNFIVLRQAEA